MSDELQNITEELNLRRKEALLASLTSYYKFFKLFFTEVTGAELVDNWHIQFMCNKLQNIGVDLIEGNIPEYDTTIFNVPPGSSKSTLISVLFPIWLWLHKPSLVIISSSYSATLSEDLARKSRRVINSELFQHIFGPYFKVKFGKEFQFTKETDQDFENNFGGRRFATSTNGTIIGIHGDLIIVDDNLSAQQAHSETEVLKSNRFYSETLMTRKKDKEKTKTIIVMQRLCENDLTGYLTTLNKETPEKLEKIVIPAELSKDLAPEKLKMYYEDGLMDSRRMSKPILDNFKTTLGSLSYSSQFLQNPFNAEGGILKKSWFKILKPSEVPREVQWDVFVDGAYTKNQDNDPTGILIAGMFNSILYIRLFSSNYLEMPDLLLKFKQLRESAMVYPESRIYIEPKASGLTLQQLLKQGGFNSINIKSKLVSEGKKARAHTISPFAESGRIQVVEGPWNDEFLTQLCGFPNAKHDESIDVLGYAVDHFLKSPKGVSLNPTPKRKFDYEDDDEFDDNIGLSENSWVNRLIYRD